MMNLRPMFMFLADEVVFSHDRQRLDALPPRARKALIAAVAAFLPHYLNTQVRALLNGCMHLSLVHPVDARCGGALACTSQQAEGNCRAQDFLTALATFPGPDAARAGQQPTGEGADFVVSEIPTLLGKMRVESALLKYLATLMGMQKTPLLSTLRRITRLRLQVCNVRGVQWKMPYRDCGNLKMQVMRLQAELYALTSTGGPRYVSRAVNRAAFKVSSPAMFVLSELIMFMGGTTATVDTCSQVLDELFPSGQHSRRLISLAFRSIHPSDWPATWAEIAHIVLAAVQRWIHRLLNAMLCIWRRGSGRRGNIKRS